LTRCLCSVTVTHRVRITAATDLDHELRGWLATAYALAG
jgi:hypothetical protein